MRNYSDSWPGHERLHSDKGAPDSVTLGAWNPGGPQNPNSVGIFVETGEDTTFMEVSDPDSLEAWALKLIHKARLLRELQGGQPEPLAEDAAPGQREGTYLDHLRRRAGLMRTAWAAEHVQRLGRTLASAEVRGIALRTVRDQAVRAGLSAEAQDVALVTAEAIAQLLADAVEASPQRWAADLWGEGQ